MAPTDTPIRIPDLEVDDPLLRLQLGACRLRVGPGAVDGWAEGSYHDPGGRDPVRLHVEGSCVTLSQDRSLDRAVGLLEGVPTCRLSLGASRAFRLELDTGASDVDLDLTGLPLRGLSLRAGAGAVDVRVAAPNPVDADEVRLQVGAGGLDAVGLGNLAAARLRVDGGAANLSLGLTGELRRHLAVRISAGMSAVRVVLPGDRPARISATSTLGSRELGDGFVTRDGAVHTTAPGEPVIDLEANVALGTLQLRTGR